MFNNKSIILNADSYKASHWLQYPPNTEYVYSYIEPRNSSRLDKCVFFGLQVFLKEVLTKPITQADIDFATTLFQNHGVPFYKEGWQYILDNHKGYLPIAIEALNEGEVVPLSTAVVQIVNTDPKCYWLTSYVETAILRAVWYPSTVASLALACRKVIQKGMETSCDTLDKLPFMLQDFGFRGTSSYESAALGGLAHLLSFKGTDNIAALLAAQDYYGIPLGTAVGYSIAAAEHSTITSWGRENETKAYANMLEQFSKPGALVAVVSDSYDIFNAIENIWGTELKDKVINSGGTLVIRPDCYSSDTMILTNSGWKFFKDLKESDKVAQVLDDDSYEFVTPLKIINQNYKGKMYHFKDFHGKIDHLVTPNHRMIFKHVNTTTGAISEKIVLAENMKTRGYSYTHFKRSAKATNKGLCLTPLEKIKIAFQADGSFCTNSKTSIRFSFSKCRKIERLKMLLKESNLSYKTYNLSDGKTEFSIKVDCSLMSKNFDWVNTSDLCCNWSSEFIEELSYWDSSIRNSNRFKYDTTNKSCMSVVELIAIAAGRGVLISHSTDNRSDKFSDLYAAHILKNNNIGGQSWEKNVVDYEGTVHCVTVPSGRLLVKRNRGIIVSGNSGEPLEIVPRSLQLLEKCFGVTVNSKGYKVLPDCVRLIQGDGINLESLQGIIDVVIENGYSLDNLAFGMGGGLLQQLDRDTMGWAMKASCAIVGGEARDVFKDPITSTSKRSKKGILDTVFNLQTLTIETIRRCEFLEEIHVKLFEQVFYNGRLLVEYDFDEIRQFVSCAK